MQKSLVLCCLAHFLLHGCAALSYDAGPSPSPKQTQVEPDLSVTAMPEPDVRIKVIPETPTTYERTALVVSGLDVVFDGSQEIVDETRGIRAIISINPLNLPQLFGPKNGLTERITVRVTTHISSFVDRTTGKTYRQPPEKILRKTILLRNVPPELWQRVEMEGVVRVLVQLDVPTKPEQHLSDEELQAIAATQQELLVALAGTEYVLIRQFKFSPGLVLELGPKALAVLDRFPLVLDVKENHATEYLPPKIPPMRPSAPSVGKGASEQTP